MRNETSVDIYHTRLHPENSPCTRMCVCVCVYKATWEIPWEINTTFTPVKISPSLTKKKKTEKVLSSSPGHFRLRNSPTTSISFFPIRFFFLYGENNFFLRSHNPTNYDILFEHRPWPRHVFAISLHTSSTLLRYDRLIENTVTSRLGNTTPTDENQIRISIRVLRLI